MDLVLTAADLASPTPIPAPTGAILRRRGQGLGPHAVGSAPATGRLELPHAVALWAAELARADFEQAERDEFSAEEVRDHSRCSDGIGLQCSSACALLLSQALPAGLEIDATRAHHVYATCGVDDHADEMDGPSVALVLHSDGFRFVQGRMRMELRAGDWFVFDDAAVHRVDDLAGSTSLVVFTAPLLVAQLQQAPAGGVRGAR